MWLDQEMTEPHSTSMPQLKVSEDTSRFRCTFKKGLHSTIRISRIVLETFRLNLLDVHWFVMGDDNTTLFPENLLQVSPSMTTISSTTLEPIQRMSSRIFCMAWILEAGALLLATHLLRLQKRCRTVAWINIHLGLTKGISKLTSITNIDLLKCVTNTHFPGQ